MENKDIVIESEHLLFVNVGYDLIDDYLKMLNDFNVSKYLSADPKEYTYDDEKDWVDRKLNGNEDIVYSLIHKETNEFVGNISLMDVKEDSAELGVCITSKYQNLHLGMEAMERIIEYAKDELLLNELILVVYSNNLRAIHCYEKLGFKVDKVVNKVARIDGTWVDDIYMIKKIR